MFYSIVTKILFISKWNLESDNLQVLIHQNSKSEILVTLALGLLLSLLVQKPEHLVYRTVRSVLRFQASS